MYRNHIFKKGNVWLFLCLMVGVMIFVSSTFAHEGHEHSLQDLTVHIDSHLEELEFLLTGPSESNEIINQKFEEVIFR